DQLGDDLAQRRELLRGGEIGDDDKTIATIGLDLRIADHIRPPWWVCSTSYHRRFGSGSGEVERPVPMAATIAVTCARSVCAGMAPSFSSSPSITMPCTAENTDRAKRPSSAGVRPGRKALRGASTWLKRCAWSARYQSGTSRPSGRRWSNRARQRGVLLAA